MNRIRPVMDQLLSITSQDDIMELLIQILSNEEIVPEVGNFYTFIYHPKTPDITYDEFPLIACTDIFQWGFRGANFHWNKYRNYTWEEVIGKLHLVNRVELDELLSLQYGKFRINN